MSGEWWLRAHVHKRMAHARQMCACWRGECARRAGECLRACARAFAPSRAYARVNLCECECECECGRMRTRCTQCTTLHCAPELPCTALRCHCAAPRCVALRCAALLHCPCVALHACGWGSELRVCRVVLSCFPSRSESATAHGNPQSKSVSLSKPASIKGKHMTERRRLTSWNTNLNLPGRAGYVQGMPAIRGATRRRGNHENVPAG